MAETPQVTIDPAKGGYRAHFWGANGKLVWWTQTYDNKQTAKQAVEWVQYWADKAPVYDNA